MHGSIMRKDLAKLASDNPGLRKHLVPILKEAAQPVILDRLPKPTPWTIPVPWEQAREQLAENINAFVSVGCAAKRFRPISDPYVLMLYKGRTFTFSVGRRMPEVTGNLWVETEDAVSVASKMIRLSGKAEILINEAKQGNGTVEKVALYPVNTWFPSKWARQLAFGIIESMLELSGVQIVDSAGGSL